MAFLMRLLLIWAVALSAGELKGWEPLRDKLLRSLQADPSDANLSVMIPQLDSLPEGPRLELARRFSEARPDSDASAVAVADAYGAIGMNQELLSILEAALFARPGDQDLPGLAADCMARWRLYEQAAALLARSMDESSDPERYLRWHLLLDEYSSEPTGGGLAEKLKREWKQRVEHGEHDLKTYLLLAQALFLDLDFPALQRLCESALASFPQERRFYEHMSIALKIKGDLAGLEALRRTQIRSLSSLTSSDYAELARALLMEGNAVEARRSMAGGLKDGRLSQAEREKLARRNAALEAFLDAIQPDPPGAEPCTFKDTGAIASVDCGGKRLAYDFASRSFRTSESPAQAARLAAALLDRFDSGHGRSAAADREKSTLPDDTLIRLKAAGYMGP